MRFNHCILLACILLILIGALALLPVSDAHALKVDEIVRRALKQDEQARKVRKRYLYDLTVEIQKLGRDGHVRGRDVSRAVVEPQDQVFYPISAEDGAQTADKKKMRETQKRMAVMDLKKLAPRFKFALAGTETVQGATCYIIRFTPKPNQPYDSKEEKVVNQLHGAFWIDRQTFSIVKSSGSLKKAVSVVPLIANMRELSFVYKTARLPNQTFAPASFQLLYDMQTPVSYVRRREVSHMANYRSKEKMLKPAPSLAHHDPSR